MQIEECLVSNVHALPFVYCNLDHFGVDCRLYLVKSAERPPRWMMICFILIFIRIWVDGLLLLFAMKAVARNMQNLLFKSTQPFSGFGTTSITQRGLITLTSTKTTWFPEPIPPIKKSITSSKIRISTSLLLSETCVMSTQSDNQAHFPLTMEPIPWRILKNSLISSLLAKTYTTAKWMLMKSWGESPE